MTFGKYAIVRVLAIVAGLVSNTALAEDSVLTPLKTIYQGDLMRDKEPFSERLQALHEAALQRSQELEGPVSGLDFDYAVNGQDFEDGLSANVQYEVTSQSDNAANVIVTFRNFEPQTLRYDLVKDGNSWLVDDVECLSPNCNWVLSELYAQGAAQTE